MEEGVAGKARARGYLAPSILTVAKRGHIICGKQSVTYGPQCVCAEGGCQSTMAACVLCNACERRSYRLSRECK